MLSLIAAVARNRVIGKNNQLLWHLPEDMKHFREVTRGKPVIMGRKTWESLPEKFRPLPGRHNIVVSRNLDYKAPGATLVSSLEDAIDLTRSADETFDIGGETLYRQALECTHRIYPTEIDRDYMGDAFFPEFSCADWKETSRRESGSELAFVVYEKIR